LRKANAVSLPTDTMPLNSISQCVIARTMAHIVFKMTCLFIIVNKPIFVQTV